MFIQKDIRKDIENYNLELHDTLNSKIWDSCNELRPVIRNKILKIVKTFKDQVIQDGICFKVFDIYILGSNANYNYTDDSDLDIHVIADESTDCSKKHLPLLYNAYRTIFNNNHDIKIKGINTEIYIENKADMHNVSAGVYSLKKGWLKNPTKYEKIDVNTKDIQKQISVWENRYFDITNNPTKEAVDSFINDIYDLRINSITTDGEFGEGNLIFKEIRRLGFLDDLKKLKNKLIDKDLSLEGLNEFNNNN